MVTDARPRRRGAGALVAVGLAGVLALAGCTATDAANPAASPGPGSASPSGADLLQRLRGGGLVIVFRHAATDRSKMDADERGGRLDLDDCATQRNLSPQGRTEAEAIGTAFRDLAIPVGQIWASPYCRARDTAELAFGRAEVVGGLERLYPTRDETAQRRLNQLLRERAPAPGEPNLVVVAHGVYPDALTPSVTLGEGDAAIYSLRGNDAALLGHLTPSAWTTLDGPPTAASPTAAAPNGAGELLSSVVSVQARPGQHRGSGFRVAIAGVVVTNAHILRD